MDSDDNGKVDTSYASTAAKLVKVKGIIPGIGKLDKNKDKESKPRKPSIMYGTSKTGKDESEELLAADVSLVATGVSKDATANQLKEFNEGKGIHVVGVEKLTKDDVETRTNTFKVVIKPSDYEKAMQPEIWPYRVGVRPPKRPQGMSWQKQSQQSGGHLQQQQHQGGQHHRAGSRVGQKAPQKSKASFSLDLNNKFQVLTDQNGEVFIIN